ncbi:MAG: exodeoxyribonuclease V subunit alpha [Propionibacteriaceae bacterium]|jgi:exodeoxyribonuclease V alpha subunit|nr:exodeoxyribonuclease V subunit alpha [Propionibacteriaceae bacterium]
MAELAELFTAGELLAAEKIARLYGERDPLVLSALAMTIKVLESGSVCLDLELAAQQLQALAEEQLPDYAWPGTAEWLAALTASPMVETGTGFNRPLHLVGTRLYLQRYYEQEQRVQRRFAELAAQSWPVPGLDAILDAVFGANADPYQRQAAATAAQRGLTIVAGGPGTGKTYTIAKIISTLQQVAAAAPVAGWPAQPRIALAAPTGKAATRITESLLESGAAALSGVTIHRLLGYQPGKRTRFAHDGFDPLPYDVVIVDEASMVPLLLMDRLLAALPPGCRLVLVGDPDQLAPVLAGAVLSDITTVASGTPSLVRLRQNHRFSGAISDCAAAVLAGDPEALLAAIDGEQVRLVTDSPAAAITQLVLPAAEALIESAHAAPVADTLARQRSLQLLCAHRIGPAGAEHWNAEIIRALRSAGLAGDDARWFAGMPLLYGHNSADLGLSNGDTGVVYASPQGLVAHFGPGDGVPVQLLEDTTPSYAITVHKAQGSQFQHVILLLPGVDSPLLTRELLYTALTRAQSQVTIIGSIDSLTKAVNSPALRVSGFSA